MNQRIGDQPGAQAADRQETQRLLLLVGLFGTVAGAGIIWLLVRRVTQPLRQLRDTAEAVGRGDYTRRVEVNSGDECGELAAVFNQMIESEGVLGQLHVPLEPGGWPTVDLYVRKGLGVALLPSSVVARHRGGLLVRELHPSIAPSNVVRLICRKHPLEEGKLDLSETAQVFRDLLRAEAARLRREEPTTGEKKK